MTLDRAIKLLERQYEKAKRLTFVNDPVAYSLYKVWKLADIERVEKNEMQSK